ncbi:mttA/Hcf106 family [Rubrobacter radiotolerans]|uniref:MttA/Hcf106 family n=1 Tax=Rubrobacter radiotolerans TaxID=42256 RepID=A0A023X2I3_RUBRA|nr:twin-arginine translocase TatA/TatE family subunit [Rubrobacter radiotolerans]AHY46274.1 mttA/Hcf106 family [Rubrobacter radiotolerans]MDX5893682.1 twin-arginine translocase TatA/TatE family subunit [Rubrobacter radiotolerans]SMC04262.1 sec-independent protein translocase protein TatA [Rubrobacter radiotolerans DSM 5868]
MGFGVLEVGILLFVVFLILGPKRIQGLLKSLGRSAHDFVDGLGGPSKEKNEEKTEKRSLPPGDRDD